MSAGVYGSPFYPVCRMVLPRFTVGLPTSVKPPFEMTSQTLPKFLPKVIPKSAAFTCMAFTIIPLLPFTQNLFSVSLRDEKRLLHTSLKL